MPLLDVEKAILNEKFGSRFKLSFVAALRSKELHEKKEDEVLPCQVDEFNKYTTKSLYELIEGKIDFIEENEEV
jgi:DNA-directed RNA polymerase omega subunit